MTTQRSYTLLRCPTLTTLICTVSSTISYMMRKSPARILQFGEPLSFLQPDGLGLSSSFIVAFRILAWSCFSRRANSFSADGLKITLYLDIYLILLLHLLDCKTFTNLTASHFRVRNIFEIFHVLLKIFGEQLIQKFRWRSVDFRSPNSKRLVYLCIHIKRRFSSSSHKHLCFHISLFAAIPQLGKRSS